MRTVQRLELGGIVTALAAPHPCGDDRSPLPFLGAGSVLPQDSARRAWSRPTELLCGLPLVSLLMFVDQHCSPPLTPRTMGPGHDPALPMRKAGAETQMEMRQRCRGVPFKWPFTAAAFPLCWWQTGHWREG